MDGRGGSRRRKGDNRVGNWEVCSDLLRVPLDPLEWQISQESANAIVAWLANTIGATTRGCFSSTQSCIEIQHSFVIFIKLYINVLCKRGIKSVTDYLYLSIYV
ncbi:hypothetical protein JHK82_022108 [Glycine max]|nr:hypothetical protein JHK82_022108 [Glycine max]